MGRVDVPDSVSSLKAKYIVTWRRDENRMPVLIGLLQTSIPQDTVKTWNFYLHSQPC